MPTQRLLRLHLLLSLPILASSTTAVAGAPAAPKTFDVGAIDAYVAGQVRERGYPGLSLTVVSGGEVVLAKGYGRRDLEADAPVTPDTPFAIGSVTKQFACACALLLAEEGKLSVDDPVAKYFPTLSRAGDVTLYDLMTHASGYPDYYPLDFVDRRMKEPIAPDALLAEYAGGALDFEPGTRWSYSNTGYVLLGRVIEKVAGEPFGAFLKRRILDPIGMKHSAFGPAGGPDGRARGYNAFALGPPEPAPPEGDGWIHAAGGLWASAADLARWDLALIGGKVLRPDSYRLMTTPRPFGVGSRDYGCGLSIARNGGEIVLAHNGGVSGFQSFNAIVPRTKSAVILLTNGDYLDPGSLHRTVLDLLIRSRADRKTADVPAVRGPSPKEAALDFLHQMQAGRVDRDKLGDEFNAYLTDDRLQSAAPRLKALGEPEKVEVVQVYERGGMEVAVLTFKFKDAVLKTALYRTPDGKIQQLLFARA